MRNERLHDGDRISVPAENGALSGSPILALGAIPGVLATDEGEGGNIEGRASVWTKGVFTLPCADAVAAEGTLLYITSAEVITTTASGNTAFGRSIHSAEGTGGTKSAGAGTVHVRLNRV